MTRKQKNTKDTITMILLFAAGVVAENMLVTTILVGSAGLLQADKLIDELRLLRTRRSRR